MFPTLTQDSCTKLVSPAIILEVMYLPSVYALPLWADPLILDLSVYGSTFFFSSVDTITWIIDDYTYLSLSYSCASLHQNKFTGPRQGKVPLPLLPGSHKADGGVQ
jgi:hypothetical protein